MITVEHRGQDLGTALGLTAAVNGLLFLGILWAMAVQEGLAGRSSALRALNKAAGEPLPEPASVTLILNAGPEAAPKTTPERDFLLSPDDAPAGRPANPDARLMSDRNMQAASEEDASPVGIDGLITQKGEDKPFLDLRDSDFRSGEPDRDTPPETTQPAAPPEDAPAPTPAIPPPPDPPAPAPAEEPAPQSPDHTSLAFRDEQAPALVPLREPPRPRPANSTPRPPGESLRPPPPLSRIPDRVPETAYQAGMRKSALKGTVSNKGAASLEAIETAEGRFGKSIRGAIEKGWRRRMLGLAGMANPGLVEVEFEVDAKGRIYSVRLANPGEANPVMQDCALSAVLDAKLPPPPPELLEKLGDSLTGGRMRCSFSFLIY